MVVGEREMQIDLACVMELSTFTEILAVGYEEKRIIKDDRMTPKIVDGGTTC